MSGTLKLSRLRPSRVTVPAVIRPGLGTLEGGSRLGKNLLPWTALDDLPRVHDRNTVRQFVDYPQIVCDQEYGQPGVRLKLT